VISVGEGNWYGHPEQAVLERLYGIGAAVYRTDLHGTVMFVSDGERIRVYAQ
jgi:competence protein ComEC